MTKNKQLARQSRFRLANLINQPPRYYHATFGFITHKKSGRAVILLRDLYFVDQNGRKIAMRNGRDQVDKYGRHIIADHVWINLTKPWLNLKTELLDGDEVMFKANVTAYKITRGDLIKKRQDIFEDALKKNNEIENDWQIRKITHFIPNFDEAFTKMQAEQKSNLAKAEKAQAKIKMQDYALNKISSIKVLNYKRVYYHTNRVRYDPSRIKERKYTNFLAWHSIDYAKKRGNYKSITTD